MANDLVLPQSEWEPLTLNPRWKFRLSAPKPLGDYYEDIELSRDDGWRLSGAVSGVRPSGIPDDQPTALRAGQMITPVSEVLASTAVGTSLTLRDVYLGAGTANLGGEVKRLLRASGARIVFGNLDAALAASKSCMVWCLNGPTMGEFPFTIPTDRSRLFRYERKRAGLVDRVRELDGRGFSLDSMAIPAPTGGEPPAVLSAVPKGLPIDYSLRPAAIEFSLPTPALLPSWEQIELYLVALSFAIGRRLVPVGFTLFDGSACERIHDLRSAWAVDLRADAARPSTPPVPVSESALGFLVPQFVQRATQFGLVDAMWLMWLAESVPLEAALPNLATALEGIMTAWFKSTKTKSGGKYMSDAEWAIASATAVSSLGAGLAGRPNADRIERRVRGANNFGVNERFERFFEELNLPVGEVELKAIRARNKAAHGGSFSPSQYQWLGNTIRAYRTLIARVVLALLDWNGEYVDYSTYDFPLRPMREAVRGPMGDGKPAAP